ncbi:ABC transporter permease [Sedimentibacter sp.]|uniref:ABC transporter permease n=1 Tax=Sedimentibacter sp. TaxID=1960295 RepID=UPI0028983638|nr:ABC transporter permease [Sedimentibacter sp.]
MEDIKNINDTTVEQLRQDYENMEAEIADTDSLLDKMKSMIKSNKLAAVSLVIIILFCLCAIFAPFVAPHDPALQNYDNVRAYPSRDHPLGTDELGRDVLSRIIYGARISLVIGLVPTTISMIIGTVLGLMAGFLGKRVDFVIMRLADIMLAFPSLLLAMVVMYTLGASLINIFIALSVVSWAGTARVVRSQTLALKEKEFVEAAKSIGVKKSTIMFRHILPNCLPSLIVLFTMNIPASILSESSLSFLGIGAQPPASSWGLMVVQGKQWLFSNPWIAIAPGVAILILVLAFNFLGDGLRDAIDPYMKE